jgi:hypothetical protein
MLHVINKYCYALILKTSTVKSVLSGHTGDQKSVAAQERWPFRTDCFDTQEGQKQTGRTRQMAVKESWRC